MEIKRSAHQQVVPPAGQKTIFTPNYEAFFLLNWQVG